MKKHAITCSVLAVTLLITVGLEVCAHAEVLSSNKYYTWGISGDQLSIPNGSIITEATLTIHGLTNINENINNTLTIYVLDNPPLDFISNVAAAGVDHLSSHGFRLVPDYHDNEIGTQELTYHFNQINDPNSWVWETFGQNFEIELADSTTVKPSSSLLELIDYAGNGTPFGIGFTVSAGDAVWSWTAETYFDGIDDYVEIPTTDWDISSGTIAMSAYADELPASQYIFGHTTLGSWSNRIQLYIRYGNLSLGLGDTHLRHENIALIQAKRWYHYTLTWDGTVYAVYLDGIQTVTGTYSGLTQFNSFADIGNTGYPSWREQRGFHGIIRDVQIYDRTLNSDEVLQLYRFAPNNTNEFSFRGMTLELTTKSFKGEPAQTVLTIPYGDTNRPPVMDDIPTEVEVEEGSSLAFPVNATEPDGDHITFLVNGLPDGASFKNGLFEWTPSYDLTRYDTDLYEKLTFIASDGKLEDSKTVRIRVVNTNRSPIMDPIGNKTVSENENLSFSVSATDPDGDEVEFRVLRLRLPADARLKLRLPADARLDNNVFSWTPGFDQAGVYSALIIVRDEHNAVDVEAIRITVNNTNRPPVFDKIDNQVIGDRGTLTFQVSATDPDGDKLTFSVDKLPPNSNFDAETLLFTWDKEYVQTQEHYVTFIVSDEEGLKDTSTVKIILDRPNI